MILEDEISLENRSRVPPDIDLRLGHPHLKLVVDDPTRAVLRSSPFLNIFGSLVLSVLLGPFLLLLLMKKGAWAEMQASFLELHPGLRLVALAILGTYLITSLIMIFYQGRVVIDKKARELRFYATALPWVHHRLPFAAIRALAVRTNMHRRVDIESEIANQGVMYEESFTLEFLLAELHDGRLACLASSPTTPASKLQRKLAEWIQEPAGSGCAWDRKGVP